MPDNEFELVHPFVNHLKGVYYAPEAIKGNETWSFPAKSSQSRVIYTGYVMNTDRCVDKVPWQHKKETDSAWGSWKTTEKTKEFHYWRERAAGEEPCRQATKHLEHSREV